MILEKEFENFKKETLLVDSSFIEELSRDSWNAACEALIKELMKYTDNEIYPLASVDKHKYNQAQIIWKFIDRVKGGHHA